jgi:hypothetical protein
MILEEGLRRRSLGAGLWLLVFGLSKKVFGFWSLVFQRRSLASGLWSFEEGLWLLVFGLW